MPRRRTLTPWEDLAIAEDSLRKRSRGKRIPRLGHPGLLAWPSRGATWTANIIMIALFVYLMFWVDGWWRVVGCAVVSGVAVVCFPPRTKALGLVYARARGRILHDAPIASATTMHATLDARRAWWRGQIDGAKASGLRRNLNAVQVGYGMMVFMILLSTASMAFEALLKTPGIAPASGSGYRTIWSLFYAGTMWSFIIWSQKSLSRRITRIREALTRNTCVACGYDLSGLRAENDPPGRVLRGPGHCPECACAWPLVPPAVPPEWDALASSGSR